jgi:hypothetical protein
VSVSDTYGMANLRSRGKRSISFSTVRSLMSPILMYRVPTDTNVSVMPVERSRIFRLNEFVEFSQMDLSEICWNYSAIAQDIVRGAQEKAASMIAKSGVP